MQILITGVSSGIGHGLAQAYLERGATVYGCSRRSPEQLPSHSAFHFVPLDLGDESALEAGLASLLQGVSRLDLVILNAGVLGYFGDLASTPWHDLRHTMDINVWANKRILDWIFAHLRPPTQVVAMSSGASVNGNRGWSGYSISKAALNMLIRLYAREQPRTHFSAFAPGLVDSEIQATLCRREKDDRFPTLEVLRDKRGTDEMPPPRAAADRLIPAMARLPDLIESGQYADVRTLPR